MIASAVWGAVKKRHKAKLRKMSDEDSLADISFYIKHQAGVGNDPMESERPTTENPIERRASGY